MSYQWLFNGANLVNSTNAAGVTTPTLTLSNITPTGAGPYSVRVSNAVGAVTSSDALLSVINDVLDFSKMEAGKLTFEVIDFELRECVDEQIESLLRLQSSYRSDDITAALDTEAGPNAVLARAIASKRVRIDAVQHRANATRLGTPADQFVANIR